jgi:5-(carboxyamino)imidazole ribonucleotide mutase
MRTFTRQLACVGGSGKGHVNKNGRSHSGRALAQPPTQARSNSNCLSIQVTFPFSNHSEHAGIVSVPLVAVIMGSSSDWETMQHAVDVLERFAVPHEKHIVSAHRTPVWMAEFATEAEARGIEVLIAGAGGAAHLPGMVAAHTLLPVLGVPVQSAALQGLDSLLAIVQMPGGVPVGTLAIGKPGATNAGLLAVSILSNSRPELREKLRAFRKEQTEKVRQDRLP